jgi:hypothetical protein
LPLEQCNIHAEQKRLGAEYLSKIMDKNGIPVNDCLSKKNRKDSSQRDLSLWES